MVGDTVDTLRPFAIGAFNDCSIRRPNARKISEKKNWGPASKGVARRFFDVNALNPDGPTATMRLACHLRTAAGMHHEYGVDSPLPGYSYYGDALLHWIVERHTRPRFETLIADWRELRDAREVPDVDEAVLYYSLVGAASLPYVNAPEARLLGHDTLSPAFIDAHADALVLLFLGGAT